MATRIGINNPMYKHGEIHTKLYSIRRGMIKRCYQPTCNGYERYGGRGITVCDEWKMDYVAFRDWALANGYKDGLTLDRIDNNGNYEPSNCRWIPLKDQMQNRRTNVYLELNGERHTMSEWSRILEIPAATIKARHGKGWSDEKILATLNKVNKSGIFGVSWCPSRKKWVSSLSVKNKNIHIGDFDTPEEAAINRNKFIEEHNLSNKLSVIPSGYCAKEVIEKYYR